MTSALRRPEMLRDLEPPGGASTSWPRVRAAGLGAPDALEELAVRTLGPVRAYLRRAGYRGADVEDLAQEFFLHLMANDVIGRADPQRGRFRAYLFTCLRNFLNKERARRRAYKRGGGRELCSLDAEQAERLAQDVEQDPRAAFDRRWAAELVARATQRLLSELSPSAATAFRLAYGPEPLSHRHIAARTGLSEAGTAASLYRSRLRLRELLYEEVRATVADPRQSAEELRDLFRALGGATRRAGGATPRGPGR